jgi:alpha-glucosidase
VAKQDRDNTSVLAHYRRALAFRRAYPSLRSGSMDDIAAAGGVTSFRRRGDQDLFCAFNLADEAAEVSLPEGSWTTIGTDLGSQAATGGRVMLAPWGVALAKRA